MEVWKSGRQSALFTVQHRSEPETEENENVNDLALQRAKVSGSFQEMGHFDVWLKGKIWLK